MLPTDHGDPTVAVDEVESVDLEEPLAVRPPVENHRSRRRISGVRIALLVALGVGVGLVAGVQLQKDQVGTSVSTTSGASGSAGASRFAGGGGFAGRTGAAGSATGTGTAAGGSGRGAGGGATVGQVKLIDGTNVYVTDSSGNVVKVATAGSTISKSAPGTVTDLAIGDTVIVRGTTGTDGTVAATAITDSGAGGGSGFGRGGGRGAGGG